VHDSMDRGAVCAVAGGGSLTVVRGFRAPGVREPSEGLGTLTTAGLETGATFHYFAGRDS
jgi:hypothetical protein